MNIKRITLAVAACASILGAGNPFDLKSNFLNETEANKWSDPTTGVSYYSGPNYEYRFKDSTASVAPWLQFQLPSARIGCNGFSIEGGFMALLGLDDIKLQLENAGPTFAWGVLTTIEISMPSVAAIFQKIQQWVRKIQSLLQNACQSGKMAGEWLKKSYGFGQLESNVIEEGADEILGFMNSMEKKLDAINTLDDENNSTKKAVTSEKIHKIGSGLSFLAMDFGKPLTKCDKQTDFGGRDKVDFTTQDIISGKVGGCDIESKLTSNVFDQKVLSYLLSRVLFGELVVTPESLTPVTEMFFNGHFDENAVKRDLKSVVAMSESPFGEIEYSIYPPIIGNAKQAASFLVRGKRDSAGNALAIPVTNMQGTFISFRLSAASADHLVTDANGSVSGSNTIFAPKDDGTVPELFEIRAMYVMRPASESDTLSSPLKWEGLVEESKKDILAYLKLALTKKVGDTVANNYFQGIESSDVDLSTVKTPMLVSGMHRYLNTLVLAAVDKGGVFAVMPLVDLLAYYNAELFADQLLSHVMRQIEAAEAGPNLMTTEHTRKGFADFKKRVLTIYGLMKDELEKMKEDTIEDAKNVPELFKRIEKDMKESRIEKLGNR